MKIAIVSFGNSTGNYVKALNRLKRSLEVNFKGDVLSWSNESQLNCPLHKDNPYAFKVYAMQEAFNKGYTKVLWLDSSVWAVKDIQPVFNDISKNGFFLEDSGHRIGSWSNNQCLDWFKLTRDEANQMRMISSGFVGIDIENAIGEEMFTKWKAAMLAGTFVGSWNDHRHDQTALSIIAQRLGLDPLINPCGKYFAYVGSGYDEPQETALCHLQGM